MTLTQFLSRGRSFCREQLIPYFLSRKRKPFAVQIREIKQIAPFEEAPISTYLSRRLYETGSRGTLNYIPVRFVEQFILELNSRFPANGRPGRWEEGRIGFAIDKFAFWQVMRGAGLPAVPIILASLGDKSWIDGNGNPVNRETVATILNEGMDKLFVKKRFGLAGQGTLVPDSGKTVDRLLKRSHLIVQPRFRQHPAMAAFHPGSLNTIRLITFCDEEGVELTCGAIRVGRGGASVDNVSLGGLAAPLDPDSGTVFKAAHGYAKHEPRQRFYATHPETGAKIRGFRVPFWDECRKLVMQASEFIGPGTTLGWDLAIGPDGPKLLETNDRWDPNFMLAHFDLKSTRLGSAAWRAMAPQE